MWMREGGRVGGGAGIWERQREKAGLWKGERTTHQRRSSYYLLVHCCNCVKVCLVGNIQITEGHCSERKKWRKKETNTHCKKIERREGKEEK